MSEKASFAQKLKDQFSTKSLVLIPIAVGINLIGGTLCSMLKPACPAPGSLRSPAS